MNIVQQEVSSERLYIRATNGAEVELTRADVLDLYATTSGSRSARIVATITLVKNHIADALGRELIDPADIDLSFDDATGRVTDARWGRFQ